MLPNGQLAFRKSGRRQHKPSAVRKQASTEHRQTQEIQVPGIGRIPLFLDEDENNCNAGANLEEPTRHRKSKTNRTRYHSTGHHQRHRNKQDAVEPGQRVHSRSVSESIQLNERRSAPGTPIPPPVASLGHRSPTSRDVDQARIRSPSPDTQRVTSPSRRRARFSKAEVRKLIISPLRSLSYASPLTPFC